MSNGRPLLAPMWATDLDLTSPRLMLEHSTANAVCSNAHAYNDIRKKHREYYGKLRTVFAGYSEETLRRISVTLTETHDYQLLELICYDSLTEDSLNDWYMMVEKNMVRNAVSLYAAGLTMYKNLVPIQDGHYPAERIAQVRAITRITEYFFAIGKISSTDDPRREGKRMVCVNEEAFRDQIETCSDPIALAEAIISRHLTTIREVADFLGTLEQITSPLKEGAL